MSAELAGAGSRTGMIEAMRRREREAKAAAPVEHTSPEKIAALEAIRDKHPGVASDVQERRLLEALAICSITSFEATRYLDLYHPAARVMGLRNKGHEIVTVWARIETESGQLHRIGRYALVRDSLGGRQ